MKFKMSHYHNFYCIELEPVIAEHACTIRKHTRLKLPDAIIWATAQARQTLLVTRNGKDFPNNDPTIRIPYRLN